MADGKPGRIDRRQFVKQAAGAAVGGALLGGAAADVAGQTDAARIRNYNEAMEYRRLGRSGIMASHLGLGGHHLSGDQEMRSRVVARCLDLGINYFDTTSDGEADELGQSLEACNGRDRAYVVRDFLDARDPNLRQGGEQEYKARVLRRLEDGLRLLRTDYVDLFRMTPPESGMEEFHNVQWFAEAFLQAKEQGKCGFMGLSTHNPEFQARAVREVPTVDVIYLPYNYVFSGAADRLYPNVTGEGSLFELCHEQDKGIVTIKPFLKTALFNTEAFEQRFEERKRPEETVAAFALRYVLANPYITVTIPGMDTVAHVEANVAVVKQGPLNEAEVGELDRQTRHVMATLPSEYQWFHRWRAT
jgi:aryl-alcohol dehydrogenase-like predicted oxidoreductase